MTTELASATQASYYDGCQHVATPLGRSDRHVMRETLTPDSSGMVLVMVGLPARGKSFISRRAERFLQWRGLSTRSFNVGKYRRDAVDPSCSGVSTFFDKGNQAGMEAREAAFLAALGDAVDFLDSGGKIAILDATNSTQTRRQRVAKFIAEKHRSYSVLFLESICDDLQVLEANMQSKVSNSPDFAHMTPQEALDDLKIRIKKYEDVYETVQDHEGAFIKLFNLSSKVMANHCYGRIAKSVLPYLMAIHIGGRPIFLARAGPGEDSLDGRTDGNDRISNLSAVGRSFAASLATFVQRRVNDFYKKAGRIDEQPQVITSTVHRAIASVSFMAWPHEETSALNPIDKGAIGAGWWDTECEAHIPPWGELEKRHPEFVARLKKDPLDCRFPGGESYLDVIKRLEGLLIEVEMCTRPVVIVSHLTVLQLLIAYFRGLPVQDAWKVSIPRGGVTEITPNTGGGFLCEDHVLPWPCGWDSSAQTVDVVHMFF